MHRHRHAIRVDFKSNHKVGQKLGRVFRHLKKATPSSRAIFAPTATPPVKQAVPPAKRALFVALNYPGTDAALSGCWNDQDDLKTLFVDGRGFQEVVVLRDHPDTPATLRPTRERVLFEMQRLAKNTKKGDLLFVHYSGHGTFVRDTNGDETDGRDEGVVLDNDGFLCDDDIYAALVQNVAPGAVVRCVFDSCHSASTMDLPSQFRPRQTVAPAVPTRRKPSDIATKDVICISGCLDTGYSLDTRIDGRDNGALTWALVSAIKEMQSSYMFRETYTWVDLVALIQYRLMSRSLPQTPVLSGASANLLTRKVDIL